jgi:outer membrane receptor protein involved in Fe transport
LGTGSRFAGPEEATVYEIGLKARFPKGAFNLTLFDQAIDGFQSNTFTGTGFILANAGKQSTKGVEFDATYRPIRPLILTYALAVPQQVLPNSPTMHRQRLSSHCLMITVSPIGQTTSGLRKLNSAKV